MDSFKNNDPFKHFVKNKLVDYKKEVPHSGWEKLESSLFVVQKTNIVRKKWLVSSVAAIAAAFIGVFFVLQNTDQELPIQTAEYKVTPQVKDSANEDALISKQDSTDDIKESAIALFADNTSSKQQDKKGLAVTKRETESSLIVSTDTPINKIDLEPSSSNDKGAKKESKSNNIDEETKQQMIQDFINEGKRSYEFNDNTTTKKKSKIAISLSGRSGLTSSQQTNTLPTTLRASLSDSYSTYTLSKMKADNDEKEVNPESEVNHNQPVSFGILTSFDLTPKLQIETGIIYTYLSSETKNKSHDFRNSEKIQFHYLGIPVNLNYTVLSLNKLNLFLSAGAMIEKDLVGTIKYEDEKTNSLLSSKSANEKSSRINQKKPQFSLATGVGITYPIYNEVSLFGKIGGRYYINANNEFKTYYSAEKFGLDIQLGIKLNF